MKQRITLLTFFLSASFSFSQTNPVISSWIQNTSATGYAGILTNVQVVQYNTTNCFVSCTCIPGYDIGPWAGNPNTPSNQNFVFKFPLAPVQNTGTLTVVGLGHIGTWVNGVSIYNAKDANSYNSQGIWHQTALFFEGASFDSCLGHPAPNGEYHHHVSPRCLYDPLDSTHHSPIIGFAYDGFPVYGAYAYQNTNGTGPIVRMRSSYQPRLWMTQRDSLPDGTALTAGQYGPAVSGTYPVGAYCEDYKFVSTYGDLDVHNGRFCITPEYPGGTYCYFVTLGSDLSPVYPYTIGDTYYGILATGNTGPGSGHNTIPGGTTVYTPTGISETDKSIQFEFYPNPVTDVAQLFFEGSSANNLTAEIFSTDGKKMAQLSDLHPGIGYELNLKILPTGNYFIHIQSETSSAVQQFLKVE